MKRAFENQHFMTNIFNGIINFMKIENFSEQFDLEGASIDEMSERIGGFLENLGYEKTNILRIRLSVEEALLRWRDHFGEEKTVKFDLLIQRGRPTIQISTDGEPLDPLASSGDELGEWAGTLLSTIGLEPRYVYKHNANSIILVLPKPKRNPAEILLFSVIAGLVLGVLTSALLPKEVQNSIAGSYLQPVQDLFFRMLNVAAVPIIFLDVLSATCGAGNMTETGRSNRKIVWHFITLTTLVTLVGTLVSIPVFGLGAEYGAGNRIDGMTLISGLRSIIPSDIMTPFQAGESQQLIFLALVLGNALLIAGHQVSGLFSIVDQCHTVILFIADWVSRITPLFVVILLVLGIWDRSLASIVAIWKPITLFAVVSLSLLLLFILAVCICKHVRVSLFIDKIKKSFLVAFRNSSVNASYGLNRECCVRKLGIDRQYTDNSLPFGLVLFMPTSAMALMIFTLYSASEYDVTTSAVWILTVLLLAVALQTASPPVAGVNLLAYAAIFVKMGIPTEALILAMIADILHGFLTSAVDQAMLQVVLVFEADRAGSLNRKRLIKE